jgi:hypothetical protein
MPRGRPKYSKRGYLGHKTGRCIGPGVLSVLQFAARYDQQRTGRRGDFVTLNYRFRRKFLPSAVRALTASWAMVLFAMPLVTHAQFTGSASGTVQYSHDNNVFAVNSGSTEQFGPINRSGGDSLISYQGAFDISYLLGRQELYATASDSQVKYQHFSDLDHNDYNIDLGLKWKLSDIFDGKFDVGRTRNMVQFYDLNQSTLSVNTSQRETAELGMKVAPEWRLEATASRGTVTQPLTNEPDLKSTDTTGTLTGKYLGVANFTMGVDLGFTSGNFQGTTTTTSGELTYRQSTLGAVATYVSGHSTFNGQIGYTKRSSSDGLNDTSGITGDIAVNDQITPKTSVQLEVSRALNSYFLNTSAEVDTTAAVSVNWQATYKLNVNAGYTFTYRQYPGQNTDPIGADRTDAQQYVNLSFNYQPLRWLSIRPYANVLTRVSNQIGAGFSQTVFGVSISAATPSKPKARR